MSFDSIMAGPVLIAGAGALGLVMGGMLKASGHQVHLLGRPLHVDAIERQGLLIDGLFGRREVGGFELSRDIGELAGRKFPLILVTVKSYDTAELAGHLPALLARDGLAVSAQNGLGNLELLAGSLGGERVVAARVIFGAHIEHPGRVRVTVIAEPVAIGPAPDLSGAAASALLDKAGQFAGELSAAGIPAHPVADVRPLLWTKLFYNAALNPLGALLKVHYGALGADPELRCIMDAIVHEAFTLAHSRGVALPFHSAAQYLSVFYQKLLPATFDHRPSMLADLEHRGRTEIGALNGRIVEMAASAGLDAPVNRMITALIRARERHWRPAVQPDW